MSWNTGHSCAFLPMAGDLPLIYALSLNVCFIFFLISHRLFLHLFLPPPVCSLERVSKRFYILHIIYPAMKIEADLNLVAAVPN